MDRTMSLERYQAAMTALQNGDTARGAASLSDLLSSATLPSNLLADALGNYGTALSMLGRHEEALAVLRASAAAQPSVGNTHYNLGILLAEEQEHKGEAEAHYRLASKLDPTLDDAHNNLGHLLVHAGRWNEAAAAYRATLHANPRHAMAYNNLANVLRGGDQGTDDATMRAAGRCYSHAVRLSPTYVEAYRNLGNMLKERPLWRRSAVRAYRSALALQPDGRTVLLNLGETLQWLGRPAAANKTFALAVARGVWQHAQQRPSQYVPGLRAAPWWELSEVPELLRLFRSKETIETLRDEGIALLRRGTPFLNYFSPALVAGKWSDVMLAVAGFRQPGADHAPRSYALYEAFGEAVTTMVLGQAYFSVLSPGARLQAHCGPTNARLRVHIGLSVPENAAMRVGNETRRWREGEAFIFDDSFEHEVWNEGSEPRLVFIFDVWHPQLSTDEARLEALRGDRIGTERYVMTRSALRAGAHLPSETDLLKDRRTRTIY
jgi:tetratricopeptide (TPR) repeat protein